MKAKDRKRAQKMLEQLPASRAKTDLQEEFERKGFLSRRELKILDRLATMQQVA